MARRPIRGACLSFDDIPRQVLNTGALIRGRIGVRSGSRRPLREWGFLEDKPDKVTIRLPKRFIKALDFLVAVDDFPSRAEAIRAAVRDLVYTRIDLVPEKAKRIRDAELALEESDHLRKNVLRR